MVKPVDFDDFNFRVDLKEENKIPVTDLRVKSMLKNWDSSKKIYRFIKRFSFVHKHYPLKIDCSIVKTSKKEALTYPRVNTALVSAELVGSPPYLIVYRVSPPKIFVNSKSCIS